LINSYDNAIRYNVDGFFHRLDMTSRRPGTTLLYTSDHGQSLHEQGELWNHCSDQRGGSLNRDREAMVPLFMINTGEKARDASAAFNRASHANVFATLLDLMGVPGSSRRHAYEPTLLAFDHFAFRPRDADREMT
jgi:glucan phosphoethanolaminetransferase (alkaline phosphatase superfamily)